MSPAVAGAEGAIPGIVAAARAAFDAGRTKPLAWRRAQLRGLERLLEDGAPRLERALRDDLAKSPTEAHVTEIGIVRDEVRLALRRMRAWTRRRRVPVPLPLQPARAFTVREPLGVVLVIAPWNYPVQLLLAPLVGALAAGNAVVLKPSELAPATSAALAELVPRYLDRSAIAVVEGAAEASQALLAERFDHIFFTGGARVGRLVLEAAARTLTPVTLELGGKSPVFVDEGVDVEAAARRIAWGKFVNAGQTCVAPDYVLATPAVARALEPALARAVRELYGPDPASSPDYGRIVDERQFARLAALLADGRTVTGGVADAADRYIAPTVLADVDAEAPVMAEEIFGPILPIVRVADAEAAVRFIAGRDKPLTLYVFTERERVRRRFLAGTSSGSVGFSVPLAQLAVPGLPFGGVGASGMGAYHGERGMALFSHEKSVLAKPLRPDTLRLVYPPFTAAKDRLVRRLLG